MNGQAGRYRKGAIASAAFAVALLTGTAAQAQSVSDFRLPAGTPSASPRAQGPVDPDSPDRAAPTPVPPATPAAAPTITPGPTATAPEPRTVPTITVPRTAGAVRTPAPAAARARTAPAPTPSSPSLAAPVPVLSDAPAAAGGAPAAPAVQGVSTAPAASADAVPAADGGSSWWWWLLPFGLIGGALAAAFAVSRRKGRQELAPVIERPRPASPAADEPAAPAPGPVPVPAMLSPSAPHGPIALELEAVRLSMTLVNATLQYRLRLTNTSDRPLGAIALGADMIAAHASLPDDHQLAQGVGLELRHEIAGLAPGEQAEITGDLRLPLATVQPIRQGTAMLLVPLVRLRAEGDGFTLSRTHVIGEIPLVPGGPLRPFRLDQGPRIFAQLDQRDLTTAARPAAA